jgi:hypothetical protein
MKRKLFQLLALLMIVGMLASACAPKAQTATPEVTPEAAQESGTKIVTGQVAYTNAFFTDGVAKIRVAL